MVIRQNLSEKEIENKIADSLEYIRIYFNDLEESKKDMVKEMLNRYIN